MKKALKYQISYLKSVFIIYFIIMAALFAAGSLSLSVFRMNPSASSFSLGLSGTIVCFVTGLAMFHEHFGMLIQNGFSRKIYFKSSLCTICILSIAFSVGEGILSKIIQVISSFSKNIVVKNSIQMIFPSLYEKLSEGMGFFLNIILTSALTACLFMLGYLIAAIFYRLPNNFKTPFAILLPVCAFVILPVAVSLYPSAAYGFLDILLSVTGISSQNLLHTFLFFVIAFLLLSFISHLVVKRAEVK